MAWESLSNHGKSMLYVGDCCEYMAAQHPASVDLVFADPPFNIGYKYDQYRDKMQRQQYLDWARTWVYMASRLLSDSGSFFLAINDESVAEYKILLEENGLRMRNWIVWHYAFGPHQSRKFGRDHAHILYFVKDEKRCKFNADSIRVESERQRAGDKRANQLGRVPGDVWSVPRLPGNAKERTGHPCQMPEAILERIILATTDAGDMVFDPFAGSGTTLAVAKRLGRKFAGCEMSQAYANKIQQRLDNASAPN